MKTLEVLKIYRRFNTQVFDLVPIPRLLTRRISGGVLRIPTVADEYIGRGWGGDEFRQIPLFSQVSLCFWYLLSTSHRDFISVFMLTFRNYDWLYHIHPVYSLLYIVGLYVTLSSPILLLHGYLASTSYFCISSYISHLFRTIWYILQARVSKTENMFLDPIQQPIKQCNTAV